MRIINDLMDSLILEIASARMHGNIRYAKAGRSTLDTVYSVVVEGAEQDDPNKEWNQGRRLECHRLLTATSDDDSASNICFKYLVIREISSIEAQHTRRPSCNGLVLSNPGKFIPSKTGASAPIDRHIGTSGLDARRR
jgi:hypothetical protein